jgi:hypothetical protein
MKKGLMKKLIFSISTIVIALAVTITSVFAWFVLSRKSANIEISGNANISVQGYVLKFYESEIAGGEDVFVSDNDRYPIDMSTSGDLIGDENSLDDLDSNNFLKFIFVITNNNESFDANISFRLADFSSYIFNFYDDYVSEYSSISSTTDDVFTKKDDVDDLASQYNAKFSLYFADVEYCVGNDYDPTNETTFSKGTEMTSVDIRKSPFLWNYSTGDNVIEATDIVLPKNGQITLSFKIKSQQSNESIVSYRSWLTESYGRNHLAITKYDTIYDNLTVTQKAYVDDYLDYFVAKEMKTIYSESTAVIKETNLLIEYIEFIGETSSTTVIV